MFLLPSSAYVTPYGCAMSSFPSEPTAGASIAECPCSVAQSHMSGSIGQSEWEARGDVWKMGNLPCPV